ncbi:uncharacterized protein LOC141908032 [Tubulanus polymorphus]|uniref:uncharacterized protein LOC141908032 n=1 Tax=Tubulanus polymorphus TaxID=672921 RepID=UPI003DA42EEE
MSTSSTIVVFSGLVLCYICCAVALPALKGSYDPGEDGSREFIQNRLRRDFWGNGWFESPNYDRCAKSCLRSSDCCQGYYCSIQYWSKYYTGVKGHIGKCKQFRTGYWSNGF